MLVKLDFVSSDNYLASLACEGSKSGNKVATGERKFPTKVDPQEALSV